MDDELLAAARAAATNVADLERDLEVAKAAYRHAIRHLNLSGASVREIAKALGISHQRVQQLVSDVDDGRGWKRSGRHAAILVCSFCGIDQATARKLIAGPSVYICDACVEIAGSAARGDRAVGRFRADRPGGCDFCGKTNTRTLILASTDANAICCECLDLCDEIIADESPDVLPDA
jgi:hypothetical protein